MCDSQNGASLSWWENVQAGIKCKTFLQKFPKKHYSLFIVARVIFKIIFSTKYFQRYLLSRQYGAASHDDLWTALTEVNQRVIVLTNMFQDNEYKKLQLLLADELDASITSFMEVVSWKQREPMLITENIWQFY